jgi:hypothetical protein
MMRALAFLLVAAPSIALASPRCSSWTGQLTGNGVGSVHLVMCADARQVTGSFTYSGDEGWDRRALEGAWDDQGKLHLHDTAWLDYHVDESTYYCQAERFDLEAIAPGQMVGTFESAACDDRGPLALTLETSWGGEEDPDPASPWPLTLLGALGCALAALVALRFARRAWPYDAPNHLP